MSETTAKAKKGGNMKSPSRFVNYRDVKDELVGAPGTAERDEFELALQLHLIPLKIREFRKHHKLTQSELGARIGVQKTQISKLERSALNITLDTLLKVFKALDAKVHLDFELTKDSKSNR